MKRHLGLSEMVRRRTSQAKRRATRGALGWWAWSSDGDLRSSGRRGQKTRAKRGKRGRRGSTLLVVMALLGMLMLLGMLYFTFATQEQQNATNFAEAAKKNADLEDDIDAIFNESIRQLILGGDYPQKNSVLWGGRHSMMGTLSGQRTASGQLDRQPYTGQGVSLTGFVTPNDSPTANDNPSGGAPLYERDLSKFPGADLDHTYPDYNNMLLAYQGNTWDPIATTPPTRFPIPVIKPSFHRPELLRDFSGMTPVPLTNWAVATATSAPTSTKGLLFRPHPEHLYVWRQNTTLTPQRRFIIDGASNPGADTTLANFVTADASLIGGGPGQVSSAFPFLKDQDGDGNLSEQGAWSRNVPGGNPSTQFDAYDYDVDTDGDLIPDAIWMDLDLPVLTRPSDNKTYIPLIAFKVVDLDGLINLNGTGNLAGDQATRPAATTNFGNIVNPTDPDLSRSSMGLSSYEINPIWALDAVPGVDFTLPAAPNNYYVQYFAHNPLSGNLWHQAREAGNMEWWWLNKGRIDYLAPNVIHSGRLGEANRLWQVLSAGPNAISANSNLFPFPGVWDQDDNRDFNEGGPLVLAGLAAGQGLPFKHPLALNGLGRFWNSGNPKQLDLLAAIGGNPSRWLRYTDTGVGDDGSGTGNVALLNAGTGVGAALMVTPAIGVNFAVPGGTPTLIDDMTELVIEPKNDPRPYDEPLDPKDTLLLFMNQADRSSTGIASRVLDLMPGNIDIAAAGTSQYLPEVGKRFTTTSWDLKQFALTSNPGPDGGPGRAGIDDDNNGTIDDPLEFGSAGSDDGPRAWEWNVDTDGNNKLEWPPQFNPPVDYLPAQAENAYGYFHNGSNTVKQDPFRPQLRRLLETEFGNTSKAKQPMRLSINEFLDVEHTPGVSLPAPANSQQYADYFRSQPLHYRPLTPHSTDTAATDPAWGMPPALPTPFAAANVNNPLPPYPPTNEPDQEFWACRDRQQMARDIYVLLYTFCGDKDSVDVSTTSGDTVYPVTPQQDLRRQMAQFAVNLVDGFDRDNVITAFEYDLDLSNGWDLDDDVTTADGAGDRAIVFGTEAQELTVSEVLWLWQDQDSVTDHALTPFDETLGINHFFQVELRSVSAFDVPLATTSSTTGTNTGVWRIHRHNAANTPSPNNSPLGYSGGLGIASIALPANENVLTFLNGAGTVTPGTLFTIANADSSPVGSASLYVNSSGGMSDFEIVAPNPSGGAPAHNPTTIPIPAPVANLDLIHASHSSRFELANAGPGTFLNRTNNPDGAMAPPISPVYLRLERRLNPYLPQLAIASNPFVMVDSYRAANDGGGGIRPKSLKIDAAVVTQTNANDRLSETGTFGMAPYLAMESRERNQPFNGPSDAASTGGGPSPHKNTIGQNNSNSPAQFNRFQPHFDRDFASTIDLFHVYLTGPHRLIANDIVQRGRLSPFENPSTPVTFGQATILDEDPNGDDTLDMGDDVNGNGALDNNHYHRLLSMVEVPTRTHRQLGDPLKINRVPGRINLNTVRDPQVLGALMDDRDVMDPPEHAGADFNTDGDIDDGLPGRTAVDDRDWWFEFLRSRDGVDPTSNLFLPGVLGASRPFRDVGNLQSSVTGQSPIEDTILRQLQNSVSRRRLFDVASEADHDGTNTPIDPVLRQRLLSKIYGNSTTRSNCFVVFVTIGMFECIDTSTTVGATEPVIRIGGPLNQPGSAPPIQVQHRAMFIIDRSEAEQAFDPGGTTFDWQKLVMAKQRVN